MTNANMSVMNWLTRVYVIKNLFGTLAILNVNVINHDVGEYLHYENCKCRKRLVDKLVEECSENIDENDLISVTLNNYKNVCWSCIVQLKLLT